MTGQEAVNYEMHEPFFHGIPKGKFRHRDVKDKLVLITDQGSDEYYAVLSDPTGQYQNVLTAPGKRPFRTRASALIAAQREYPDLPRFHTRGEFPPDLETNARANLGLVEQYGISSPLIDKNALVYGAIMGIIEHREISDAQVQYKARQK